MKLSEVVAGYVTHKQAMGMRSSVRKLAFFGRFVARRAR